MSRLYVYKVRYDDGTAPCVENGLLSLALCKPAIRATAGVGDTLIGFAAKSMCADQRLVYAAVVTRRLAGGAYYREPAWRHRRDCIYEWRGGAFRRKHSAAVHSSAEDLIHDLGDGPSYPRANVVLSEDYRYFGESRPADHADFPAIMRILEQLGQGHRVNHGDRLRDQLERYLSRLWSEPRTPGPPGALARRERTCAPEPKRPRRHSC
jgi:hypothetical protein